MYQPTKEELVEMGFKKDWEYFVYWRVWYDAIGYDPTLNIYSVSPSYVYPANRQDLETLIRLFTNPTQWNNKQ